MTTAKAQDPQEKAHHENMRLWQENYDDKKRHILTPEIGDWVWWYQAGAVRDGLERAALVTGIDINQPGIIQCSVHAPQTLPVHKSAVRFDPSIAASERHQQTLIQNGSWKLKGKQQPQERHRKIWLDFCERKMTEIERALHRYLEQRKQWEQDDRRT